ncbi:ABC transporter family substrate-binding protein [Nocardiopsis ansamitocini]|uniref:Solute-binding protein family 5 domain-containing protein n=1 Tax=Nocardiopsis ansamitocini TaxID=1670832 RepID=A0A9W6UIS7_9ACTN|nr:ABC transporter family substrate-binding protein [Nocardiopsis ansamitocini]GLU47748.1 hypothetical protein Nans01_20990 [Nocardiopsis ansamitocini]
MRFRKSAALTAPVLALALLASACSGSGDGNENGGSEETLADIPAQDMNPQERDAVQDGGTFKWGLNEYPAQYNMWHPDGNLANVRRIVSGVMPIATLYDEAGAFSANTDYIEEYGVSEDGLTVDYTLNPDAVWSDGEPITWEDYKEQAEAVGGAKGDDYLVGSTDGYEQVKEVRKGDDEYSFSLVFDEPYGEWPKLFDPLYPKEYMTDPDKFNEGYVSELPVTAGPFGDVEFDDTAETVTVTRDEDWWGEPAKLDSIIFHNYANDALAQVFNNDELDGFYLGTDAAGYALLKDKENTRLTKAVNNGYRFIQLNGASPKLEDVRVRQAVVHGIDRSALAQASLEAVEWTTDPLVNRLLRSSQNGFQDNSEGFGEYDPEKAGQLLDDAGWVQESEGATRTKDGEPLEIRWVASADLQVAKDEAEIAQAMLKDIGVDVKIEAVPGNSLFTEYVIPGNYEAATYVLTGTNPFAGDSYGNYGGPFGETEEGEPNWGNNTAKITTDEVNEKFDALKKETDPERYAELANEIDRALWENGQAVPFFQRPGLYAVNADIANWGEHGLASLIYTDIGWVQE